MQALQASGQATEVRDPLPVRGAGTGEVDNSGHPFMKLLASLRNAMKQGDEADIDALESGSGSKSVQLSRWKSFSGSARTIENETEVGEGGFRQDTGQLVMNASPAMFQMAGKQTHPGVIGSDLATKKATSLSFIPGDTATAAQAEDAKAGAKRTIAIKTGDATSGFSSGRGQGAQDGAEDRSLVPLDQGKPASLGDRKLEAGPGRSVDGFTEVMAKHNRWGAAGKLDGIQIASSVGLNGVTNVSAANRNQSQASLRDKEGSASPVDEAKASGRQPSRYSVVDMRLKASAAKTDSNNQLEGKSVGKPNGSESLELNRSGLSGTDAAGRQIGNDQPAGGFNEVTKGTGAENSDKTPASFAENLAARLRDGGSMDIVRSAQIVLKDGDAGLIRLRLEPESLGGVKIELKMADKQISARIIVESDLAGEAFRSSLDSLRDAFASSGFETTSIEVEVRDGRAGTGDAGRDNSGNDEDEEGNNLYLARKAGELGDAVPAADAAYGRYGVIDLVV